MCLWELTIMNSDRRWASKIRASQDIKGHQRYTIALFVLGPKECRLLPEYILSMYHAHFTYICMEILLYFDPRAARCGAVYTGTMNIS